MSNKRRVVKVVLGKDAPLEEEDDLVDLIQDLIDGMPPGSFSPEPRVLRDEFVVELPEL